MPDPVVPALTLIPPIAAGIIIGVYEWGVMMRDVTIGSGKMWHGIQAIFFGIAGCVLSFNVPLVYILIPQLKGVVILGSEVGIRVLLGVIMAAKIHGVSSAMRGSSIGIPGTQETWFHSLIVGSLVAASPYLFPFIKPILPAWVK